MDSTRPPNTTLHSLLTRAGLLEYEQVLEENGFDTWESVMDINEMDMQKMKFKLGHRRKLQRGIDTLRGQLAPTGLRLGRGSVSGSVGASPSSAVSQGPYPVWRPRLYATDTPQADPNAPEKPTPAYSRFRTMVQTELSGKPIIEVSRIASERWSNLSLEQQIQDWLKPYAKSLQEYEAQLKEYKDTDDYQQYKRYLEDFDREHRSRHSDQAAADHQSSFRAGIDNQMPSANERQGAVPSMDDNAALAADLAIGTLGRDWDIKPPAMTSPPTQEMNMLAVTSFFTGTGQRFFLWNNDHATALVQSIQNKNVEPEPWALMEVAAIAAVGACCDADCFPLPLQNYYYSTCLRYLSSCEGDVSLRLMRLVLCLSLYCTLEQPLQAHKLVNAAFAIGRLVLQQRKQTATMAQEQENDWRKVWRTAVFMESWLHYGLGFPLQLNNEDIQFGCQSIAGADSTLENMIQYQISQVGLLAVDVAVDVKSRDRPEVHEIKAHMEKMEVWYRQLPAIMRISTLNSAQAEIFTHFQKRSVLLVHMLCLGAVTLLHRPLLITIGRNRAAGIYDLEFSQEDDGRKLQDYCSIAAQQASRIAAILQFDKTMPKRCWIAIFQSFSACSILLFSASQKLLYGSFGGFEDDLNYTQNFLNLLTWCATAEPVAKRCLDIVTPIAVELKKLAERFYYAEGQGMANPGGPNSTGALLPPMTLMNEFGVSNPMTDAQSMPPPPTPVRRGSHASEAVRGEISRHVHQITRLLLDPYSMVYDSAHPYAHAQGPVE